MSGMYLMYIHSHAFHNIYSIFERDQASCARKTKLKAIEYKGGKCIVCGYNKSIRALQFHHLDPTQKDFGISGTTKSFEKLKPELDKCVLLCANCHGEVHEGLLDINKFI